ncbi:PREDICTED: elongation factor Tu GTP-binding domain-containing protein 1 [Vollenhovia emeryi]|uniref:elongation factor Tu GTP-binding domain-containing protein 1 n=1 Tax=Vollenhovia emeryi TaxID=411798 RepID=UPI0005F54C35|nr:PREDICTED: elongation factor Tu GTP-binding domain-containing protein 1 [Vollenhovia emeryi]XP_011871395.1 PREDICTED: elongation factor Tu GTP-binding domain-containing protein 1 [Vollenhovia emeryi]
MRLISVEKLSEIQNDAARIRNICILAHVDHGKTTLADSLVASNGIISGKLAGKLRYLDSRRDEQVRGITMKSSSITLHHVHGETDHVINLIDSPGHVDFSSEVSTAVRLSDGAVILVDVVEGVCPQTRSALSIAYVEGLKPILVLNKVDRLVTEMKLTPLDAYVRLTQVLEQVNAIMGELFASDVMEREEREETVATTSDKVNERDLADWQSVLEELDDSNLYFSPEQGNVLFTSAIDGWGFGIVEFAKIYSNKLGFSEKVLRKTLWGDFYINNKTKRIMKGAQEKAKKPLFVQLILDNIWALYETIVIRRDKDKLPAIAEKLNIKLTTRDLRHSDPKAQLQAVCSQWLPLARNCLDMVCENVPTPQNLTDEKIERLISGNNDFSALPVETQRLKGAFLACDPSPEAPIIAFVSKMFPAERDMLPENRPKSLTPEELAQRREIVRQKHAERLEQQTCATVENHKEDTRDTVVSNDVQDANCENEANEDNLDGTLVAFARVYSGTIKIGDEVFVLGPKHNPTVALERERAGEEVDPSLVLKDLRPGRHITRVVINKLYILMGRELEIVSKVPAGNVFGIGDLEEHVLKTATLSTTIACPSFTELTSLAVPILRVALEPKHPNDLPKLIHGLKLLNQADACAIVHMQETGEIVLSTAGEVHLERCLEDLKLRYAKIDINVSDPIVPFRETIVPPPKLDMVNEAIEKKATEVNLEVWTANRQCRFEIDARPLPENVTKLLERNANLIKLLDSYRDRYTEENGEHEVISDEDQPNEMSMSDKKQKEAKVFKSELEAAFLEAGWKDNVLDKIWSFGPRKCGPNILLNETDYRQKKFWEQQSTNVDFQTAYDNSIVNGFQFATLAGPLCEESMMGVCFVLKKWEIFQAPQSDSGGQSQGHLGGQLMSACKEACRRIFSLRHPRLMTAMYSCSVLANSDVLGRLYAVFGKRQGHIVSTESAYGFGGQFRVLATLPVLESFHLARELRTQTSGLASPQLVFSHWEVVEQDPYWVPSTEEEYLHFGEKADCDNRAKCYMDAVRRRKGLPVHSQVVTHGAKQRTLSKKK